jgi:L-histidine Nalpha-methyltransferase
MTVDVHVRPGAGSTLAEDVRAGLGRIPKSLPAKHFYDEAGSELFDAICDTPEYYQTRTEQALLEAIADELLGEMRPTDIVELGSGASRKTRALLDAAGRLKLGCRYVPFDVSGEMLRRSALQLLATYPWLRVHGVVGDYDHHLDRIPAGERRLIVFLGGTIGNFADGEAQRFLGRIAATMGPEDRLLLGTDLVKDRAALHAAYNDAAGITAAFNKNVLRVINRELDGRFDLDRFEHVAFFHEASRQIEMHLRALGSMQVEIGKLGLTVPFADGETIHTEISRKFTRDSVAELYARSGLEMSGWHVPANEWFAISVARRKG